MSGWLWLMIGAGVLILRSSVAEARDRVSHADYPFVSINNRVDDLVVAFAKSLRDDVDPLAGTLLDTSGPVPRVIINVTERADVSDQTARVFAHEDDHAIFDILSWAQHHNAELDTLDLSRDPTHDVDHGMLVRG